MVQSLWEIIRIQVTSLREEYVITLCSLVRHVEILTKISVVVEADVEVIRTFQIEHLCKTMVKMSQGTKERLSLVINATQFVFRWGFIPTILYLGV